MTAFRTAIRGAFAACVAWTACLPTGCASLTKPAETSDRRIVERGQLVFYTNVALDREPRLVDGLTALREEIETKLKLRVPPAPIRIHLFESPEKYAEYMRRYYPELPPRPAYFLQTETRLTVYAQWGPAVAEDLRHEVSHGYLHAALPRIPLWMDEGLAEYFEVAPDRGGVNVPHLRLLTAEIAAGRRRPDLARLERLHELSQFSQLDYAESWAWVHWLLDGEGSPRQVLTSQIVRLSGQKPTGSVAVEVAQFVPEPEVTLLRHLDRLSRLDAEFTAPPPP